MTQSSEIHGTSIRVGGRRLPFLGIRETSEVYRETIERLGLGGSQTPACEILDGDMVVAHVSYNGRVWAGSSWVSGAKPIYDPYANGGS